MAGITLAQAQANLDAAIAAQLKAMESGQAYGINTGGSSRNMQRVSAGELQAAVDFWDRRVQALSRAASGRGRAVTVVSV